MLTTLIRYSTLPLVLPEGLYSTQLNMTFQNDFLDLVDNKDFSIQNLSNIMAKTFGRVEHF